ncbi:hypothetical protein GCM10007989_03940 [Devosia pacifica]|uniref:DUF4282 domain-containing protein n=1 Tax=Devosia pacifica TaxID=1335967 RepID=A0A918RX05_9HYPH|nr:DUF4282 domain-containing protein [Devosia pacifica]GHA12661.1 hypothetical protein GCM10007989_03940 [Devosia pacifica]
MTFRDLRRLFTGPTLFRLDAILAPRLIQILYALGLAGLLLWAVSHFFWRFSLGFGQGLWGILEILVFGLLMFTVLRIGCEALLVYFRDKSAAMEPVVRTNGSLLDEVRDAIRDLADGDEEDEEYAEVSEYEADGPSSGAASDPDLERGPASIPGETHSTRPRPTRTARRNPAAKP